MWHICVLSILELILLLGQTAGTLAQEDYENISENLENLSDYTDKTEGFDNKLSVLHDKALESIEKALESSIEFEKMRSNYNEIQKKQFQSWAGKRSGTVSDKRNFQSWAGKRSQPISDKRNFQSWAGKRSHDDEEIANGNQRSYTAWLDKRADVIPDNYESKRNFQAWAGKRSNDLLVQSGDKQNVQSWTEESEIDPKLDDRKRTFQSWAGKRSPLPAENLDVKREFQSWAGKRDIASDDISDMRKRGFQSWAGKRYDYPPSVWDHSPDKVEMQSSFNPWAGKKSYQPSFAPPDETERVTANSFGARAAKESRDTEYANADVAESGLKHTAPMDDKTADNFAQFLNKRASGDNFNRRSFNPWAGK